MNLIGFAYWPSPITGGGPDTGNTAWNKMAMSIKALRRSDIFDPRKLRRALLGKAQAMMREEALEQAGDPVQADCFLRVILATHPEL